MRCASGFRDQIIPLLYSIGTYGAAVLVEQLASSVKRRRRQRLAAAAVFEQAAGERKVAIAYDERGLLCRVRDTLHTTPTSVVAHKAPLRARYTCVAAAPLGKGVRQLRDADVGRTRPSPPSVMNP